MSGSGYIADMQDQYVTRALAGSSMTQTGRNDPLLSGRLPKGKLGDPANRGIVRTESLLRGTRRSKVRPNVEVKRETAACGLARAEDDATH